FTDRYHRLGINYAWLTVNGRLLYEYKIEKLSFEDGRFMNTHIDPYFKYKTGLSFVRLFKEAFNAYPYYKQNDAGEIFIRRGDTAYLKLYAQDFAGHTDSLQ